MSLVKRLLVVMILTAGASVGQSPSPNVSHSCVPVLRIDSVVYANTKDETVDSVTVCEDGAVKAFHSFTAPAFGTTPAEPTKWEYSGSMDKEALDDLRKFAHRSDVAALPEQVNVIRKPTPVDSSMRFVFFEKGIERAITANVPYSWCDEEIPQSVRALICLYADLVERTKPSSGTNERVCGCKPLHEMAAFQGSAR